MSQFKSGVGDRVGGIVASSVRVASGVAEARGAASAVGDGRSSMMGEGNGVIVGGISGLGVKLGRASVIGMVEGERVGKDVAVRVGARATEGALQAIARIISASPARKRTRFIDLPPS